MRSFAIVGLLAIVCTTSVWAGLYSPDEPFYFEIGSDGYAKPIQFSGGFESFVTDLRQVSMLPKPGDPPNTIRQKAISRVEQRQKKGTSSLTQEELAGYTADLIRLNRSGDALNILQPLARDPRRGGFLADAHLAVAHAAMGGWPEAADRQQNAVRYSEFPTSFATLTKPQLAWLKRIEREYYLPFLANRAEESRQKRRRDLNQEVDPLFPSAVPPKKASDPFRVGVEGVEYKAGSIVESERKKLPPDAIAIVQQLVLWHPQDARLYWLLGELYNAEGETESALRILDHCSFNMGYSNPTLLRHRQVLQPAVTTLLNQRAAEEEQKRQAELAAEAAQKQRDDEEQRKLDDEKRESRKRFWWILSIGVAIGLMLIYYQFREVIRRVRRGTQRV